MKRRALDADTTAPTTPARGRAYLFARQQKWLSTALASRLGGVIVATRTNRGRANRDVSWYDVVRRSGAEIVTWEWALDPGRWRDGLTSEIAYAQTIGARAVCLNSEPMKDTSRDWRGRHAELRDYTEAARDQCDARGLELWVTSWALPSTAPRFPWLEFLAPAHAAIVQCYEVHGREGGAYVAQAIAEYRERGAKRIILGRGAHELDETDADAWRTSEQIAAHRASTPPGLDEAWWTPPGVVREDAVDAIVKPG